MRFFLAFIVLISGFFLFVLLYIWSRLRRLFNKVSPQYSESTQSEQQPSIVRPQTMSACVHCGLHVPEDEAYMHLGKAYCCAEHVHTTQTMQHP